GELLKSKAGIDVLHVPYKGLAPAINDVVGGQVHYTFSSYTAAKPLIETGKVRPLAVTGATRMSGLPDIPTISESGFPDYNVTTWFGYAAPAGTPRPIIERLNKALNAAVQSPAFAQRFESEGLQVIGTTPEQLRDHVVQEIETWA